MVPESDRKDVVRETLVRLGLNDAAVERALLRPRIAVNPGHYDEKAFWLCNSLWKLAAPTIELPRRQTAVQLDAEKLAKSNAKFQNYLDNCICNSLGCQEKLDRTNSVALWRGQRANAGVDKSEFEMLRCGQNGVENKRLKHFSRAYKLRIDHRHFNEDQLLKDKDGTLRRRKLQTATFARPPSAAKRTSPDDRSDVRVGRAVADKAGLQLGSIGPKELTKLGAETNELRRRLAKVEEAHAQLQAAADKIDNHVARRYFMMSLDDTVFCKQITDEPNMACLKAKFAYLNARGALDHLQYWVNGATQCKRRSTQGRKRILTSFESYVLYRARLRAGSACVRPLDREQLWYLHRDSSPHLPDIPSRSDIHHGHASAMAT
jgi:hypothetical protein